MRLTRVLEFTLCALLALATACTPTTPPAPQATTTPPAAKGKTSPPPAPPPLVRLDASTRSTRMVEVAQAGMPVQRWPSQPADRETYQEINPNPVRRTAEHPVSTFSIDVDTGAYANVRRFLREGRLPPKDAVRLEEMINYFPYAYPAPKDEKAPFAAAVEMAPTPWNPHTLLLRLGVKGYEVKAAQRPAANLVFLIDVSGSMNSQDKLPLLKSAFGLLVKQLGPKDRVTIVVYSGAAGVALPPTPGDQQGAIMAAVNGLRASGSTAGGQGIQQAYAMARQAFIPQGVNRILLATDGDFNVGISDHRQLVSMVERERKSGVGLTALGFGRGNYNERLMERLADAGNGNYFYIDNLNEAQKVLVDQLSATMLTIAQDVKIQVEFNPALVAEYRLIGYENRLLKREDFTNDKVDAGDIGAGHTVTALYEIALTGSKGLRMEPLRYAPPPGGKAQEEAQKGELAFLKIRYKLPEQSESRLMEKPILAGKVRRDLAAAPADFRWAAAVAAFGEILRGGVYTGSFGYPQVLTLAQGAKGDDPYGYRGEFLSLVRLARTLDQR